MSQLSPTQHGALQAIVEAFDAAIVRERERWGETSAEAVRAKGVALADINIKPERFFLDNNWVRPAGAHRGA